MQSLVYIFIALAGLGVGATAYFGFTFSPIEAVVVAVAFVSVAMLLLERTLRRRAEARLERAIEDLSRLLSTDAQAGSVLGQRIATLTEQNAGARLDAVEADISVLGTVVRQVAEAVADLEETRKRQGRREVGARPPDPVPQLRSIPPSVADHPAAPRQLPSEVVVPPDLLQQALDDNRLVFHLYPIVTLPLRKTHGYDLVPRLPLEDATFAGPADFLPRHGGETAIRRIERLALEEAITIARRSRAGGQPTMLYVPLSRASLADAIVIDRIVTLLDANKAIAENLVIAVDERDWTEMPLSEKAALAAFVGKGVGLSLTAARSLRLDFAELAGDGVRSIRFDAQRFIEAPESFTDFHTADVASYVKRFEIELIATDIRTEDQILTLLEDGMALAQGPHIAAAGAARADLVDRPAEKIPQRAEARG